MNEFIYILENASMPGIVKIGRTDRTVPERVNELSSHTGVPTKFIVVKEYSVIDSIAAERKIHERLAEYRVSENREFFRIDCDDAALIIEPLLASQKSDLRRDFETEDKLLEQAIPIVVKLGIVRPRVLEGLMGVSYEAALLAISTLKSKGILNEQNELCGSWRIEHERLLNKESEQRELSSLKAREDTERHDALIKQVKEALGDLRDPETDEAVDVRFDLSGENPAVEIRGSAWVTSEAQKRLANLPFPETAPVEPDPAVTIADGSAAPATPKPKLLPRRKPITVAQTPMIGNYQLPSMDFLQHPDLTVKPTESKEELTANARLMQQTLAQFDIDVQLGDITKGPTITRYELHPAPGVKLEKIAALSNNIAAVLKAERINILAPVPGKNTVGVEVPNLIKTKVIMRDLFESDEWRNTKARIPIVLGKDNYGSPIVSDLSKMPHLLIAGSTGSGKSVCLNAIIASLLYRFSPDQLRFVMIDPRIVELQQYNALPHLVIPVVTDPTKAILALRWVVNEMEKRYQIFAQVGVLNVASFNSRLPRDEDIEGVVIPEKLSHIVVIIDNLGDLINVAPAELEPALNYITQKSHAAGINCVLTMQHPSANVIAENTKNNIPSRIAFQCTARIESRAVLGEAGAEKLFGKGDMLYLPTGSAELIRAQGALITDQEIQNIVDFIAQQAKPSYEVEIHKQLSKPAASFGDESGIDEDEEIIQQCIEVIRSEQKASVPLLQRRLRLGYGRAARIMDELENRGIVGESKGAEPRDILIDLDGGGADGAGQ